MLRQNTLVGVLAFKSKTVCCHTSFSQYLLQTVNAKKLNAISKSNTAALQSEPLSPPPCSRERKRRGREEKKSLVIACVASLTLFPPQILLLFPADKSQHFWNNWPFFVLSVPISPPVFFLQIKAEQNPCKRNNNEISVFSIIQLWDPHALLRK